MILLLRRSPIMLIMEKTIPDLIGWREALFCGHFGPIGVGAVYTAIFARRELTGNTSILLSELPTANQQY